MYHSMPTVRLPSGHTVLELLLSGVQVVFVCPVALSGFFQRVWVLRLAGVVSFSLV